MKSIARDAIDGTGAHVVRKLPRPGASARRPRSDADVQSTPRRAKSVAYRVPAFRGLTFDLSGEPKASPLEGRVRRLHRKAIGSSARRTNQHRNKAKGTRHARTARRGHSYSPVAATSRFVIVRCAATATSMAAKENAASAGSAVKAQRRKNSSRSPSIVTRRGITRRLFRSISPCMTELEVACRRTRPRPTHGAMRTAIAPRKNGSGLGLGGNDVAF